MPLGADSDPDEGLLKASKFVAKALVSLAPGGGIAAEIIELVVGNPADRRRDRFMVGLAERLDHLERQGRISLEELAQDERVSAVLLQAIQAATRAHGEAKLRLLRHAALGGVCIDSNRATSSIVISAIDRLTELHTYVLERLAEACDAHGGLSGGFIDHGTLHHRLLQLSYGTDAAVTVAFAQNHSKRPGVPDPESEPYRIVYADLVRTGLVEIKFRTHGFEDERREEQMVGLGELGQLVRRHTVHGAELAGERPSAEVVGDGLD